MIAGIEIENGPCDPDHAPFKGHLLSVCWEWTWHSLLPVYKIWPL